MYIPYKWCIYSNNLFIFLLETRTSSVPFAKNKNYLHNLRLPAIPTNHLQIDIV